MSFIIKLSDRSFSGLPDIMRITDGKAYFYEIKSKNGIVSEIQKQTHNDLKYAGAVVEIVRDSNG